MLTCVPVRDELPVRAMRKAAVAFVGVLPYEMAKAMLPRAVAVERVQAAPVVAAVVLGAGVVRAWRDGAGAVVLVAAVLVSLAPVVSPLADAVASLPTALVVVPAPVLLLVPFASSPEALAPLRRLVAVRGRAVLVTVVAGTAVSITDAYVTV